jgi:hypothetical protein
MRAGDLRSLYVIGMNELIKTYTIYLSGGVEAMAALVIALATLQAAGSALGLFFARPTRTGKD